MSLKDKVIFMSGGSRGIGLAMAKRAAKDGAKIVVAAKTAAAMIEEDETPFTPTFKSEPAPTPTSVDNEDDDAMSYFEKLANE